MVGMLTLRPLSPAVAWSWRGRCVQVVHVVEALAACPAFDGLAKGVLIEIGNAVEYRVLDKMAAAFLQGEEIDAMVVILSGRCERQQHPFLRVVPILGEFEMWSVPYVKHLKSGVHTASQNTHIDTPRIHTSEWTPTYERHTFGWQCDRHSTVCRLQTRLGITPRQLWFWRTKVTVKPQT